MRIETILPSAATEATMRHTAQATGLPSVAYKSPEFLQLEFELLFAPGWIYAGRAEALAHPGDARPLRIAGQPLILVRNRRNEIKAFHNICSHRNALILREPVAGRPTIICPYHAWTYDLDGRLIRTPHIGGAGVHDCPGFEKENLGLRPVRVESWAGLLFVNLSGDAVALREWLRPLSERWSSYDFSELRHGGVKEYTLRTNWKHAVENYLESYHLPWVHKGLNDYSRMSDHYCFFAGPDAAGQGTSVYAPAIEGGMSLPIQALPAELALKAEYPVLFPNLLLGLQSDHFYLIDVIPEGPDRTRERFEIFFFGDRAMADSLDPVRRQTVERWDEVFLEDADVVERLQEGHASPAATGGRFSPAQDQAVHQFQRRLLERMLQREQSAVAAE
jgi:choline monooxygenase